MSGFITSQERRQHTLDAFAESSISGGLIALIAIGSSICGCISLIIVCKLRWRLQRLMAAYNRLLAEQITNDFQEELKGVTISDGSPVYSSHQKANAVWMVSSKLSRTLYCQSQELTPSLTHPQSC